MLRFRFRQFSAEPSSGQNNAILAIQSRRIQGPLRARRRLHRNEDRALLDNKSNRCLAASSIAYLDPTQYRSICYARSTQTCSFLANDNPQSEYRNLLVRRGVRASREHEKV